MMYLCRFISCNKCTTVVSDVACVGSEDRWELSHSTVFCCDPKTALERKSILKNGLGVKMMLD